MQLVPPMGILGVGPLLAVRAAHPLPEMLDLVGLVSVDVETDYRICLGCGRRLHGPCGHSPSGAPQACGTCGILDPEIGQELKTEWRVTTCRRCGSEYSFSLSSRWAELRAAALRWWWEKIQRRAS